MQLLPIIVSGAKVASVPVSDLSLLALLDVALEPPSFALHRLRVQLKGDPGLAVWCLISAGIFGQQHVPTLAGLARLAIRQLFDAWIPSWPERNLLSADKLYDPGPVSTATVPPGAKSQTQAPKPRSLLQARRAAQAVTAAHVAWQLARVEKPPLADRVFLCTLVAKPSKWILWQSITDLPAPHRNLLSLWQQEPFFLPGLLHQMAPESEGQSVGHPNRQQSERCTDWLRRAVLTAWSAVDKSFRHENQHGSQAAAAEKLELLDLGTVDIEAARRAGRKAALRWQQRLPGLSNRAFGILKLLAQAWNLRKRFDQVLEQQKLAALAEFAAGAGHEINNPLAIIAGRAQLLLQQETDEQRRRDLALINAQVRRAHEMIADIRLFARPPKPEPCPTDLAQLLAEITCSLRTQAEQQNIRFELLGANTPTMAVVDPVQIRVAIEAICRNAIEAIGHDGLVRIELHPQGSKVQITITDTGPGIPPEVRPHIFDPFYSARQAGRGLGFGLSKAWRIITLHGGSISVKSPAGNGMQVTIELPTGNAAH